jgi:hypothetical protein
VAVRLVCELLLRPPGPAAAAAEAAAVTAAGDPASEPPSNVLLCSHSRRLQRCTVREVCEYLDELGEAKGKYACEELAGGMARVLFPCGPAATATA